MLCRACVACALTAGCTATTTQPDAGSTPDASAGADAGPVLCDALSGELLPRPPSSKRLRDICGLASTGGQQPIGDSAWSTFRRDRFLDAAVDLGGVMIRRDVRWSEIERIRGTFDFSVYDTMLDEMDARGIRFLGNLAYGNPWATSTPQADEFFPPDDPQDFARFAGETARHFAGRVVAWEIWNEPNAGFRFWKGVDLSGDPYAYADLLAAAGQAIHEADPTTPVMLGGTVFTPAGGAIIVGRYKLVGRLCIVRARLQWGATTSFGALTGEINVSLPFAATAEMAIDSVAFGTVSILDSAVAVFARHAQFRNRGGVSTVYGITEAGTVVAHNTPITPTVGDFYSWNLTYETIS